MGKVTWHSLDGNGAISHYDIAFGKKTLKNIPAPLVEAVKEAKHEHRIRQGRKL